MKFYIENETKKGKNKVNLCLAGKKKKVVHSLFSERYVNQL